jgi:Transposase DDE domain
LWRFCKNPRVKGTALIEPMHETIRRDADEHPGVLLAIHDWSTLSFGGHDSKKDRTTLTHAHDVGYDLATVLMVRGSDGSPIAPAVVSLEADAAVHGTRADPHPLNMCHVDQVLGNMKYTREQKFCTNVVHVIDREADSVNHWRQWSADGHLALVRADDRMVLHQGGKTTLAAVADRLRGADALKDARGVLYHGRKARQFVGEAEVVLYRPGKRNVGGGNKVDVPGPPLTLRLIVSEVRDLKGRLLARWLLLTNVPAELADAATIALWYYFRWRIESLHKLIKGAGWQLESWLQRDGRKILNKLMLAFGACASIWALERRHDAESEAFKQLLMHLSGRQTKRDRRITTGGMLAGLWVLQAAVGPLARHGPDRLNAMLENHLPLFAVKI